MTLSGWTSSIDSESGNGEFTSSSDYLEAHGGSIGGSILVKYTRSVVCCTSYKVNLSATNDLAGIILVQMQDSGTGTWTNVYGSSSFTKTYSSPYTGTLTFYANVYASTSAGLYDYGTLTLNSTTVSTSLSAPTAAFSGTPLTGNTPLEVTFTNSSTAGCPTPTYAWTFGDGDTSTTSSPVHTYDTTGQFDVSLTGTNTTGSDTETKTDYITVYEAPSSVEVSGDDLVLVSVSKDYTVSPTGGYYSSLTYLWTVTGDDVIASDYTLTNSTSATCSITFNSAKAFEVNCAVTAKDSVGGAIGSAVSDTLEVSAQNCIAAFSADTTTPLQFATVTFTNASTGADLTYLWTISGTEDTDWEFANYTTETDEDIEINFLTTGDYDVSLQVYKTLVACGLETKSSYISVPPVVTAQSMRKSFCIVVNNTSYRNVR